MLHYDGGLRGLRGEICGPPRSRSAFCNLPVQCRLFEHFARRLVVFDVDLDTVIRSFRYRIRRAKKVVETSHPNGITKHTFPKR